MKKQSEPKMPNFPPEVFVHWEMGANEPDPYPVVDLDVNEAAELGESKLVGRYVLTEMLKIRGVVQIDRGEGSKHVGRK